MNKVFWMKLSQTYTHSSPRRNFSKQMNLSDRTKLLGTWMIDCLVHCSCLPVTRLMTLCSNMKRDTAIPTRLISASELDETLISTFNRSVQILDAVTLILKIEGLNIEAKQRKLLSLKLLIFSVLVFQKILTSCPQMSFSHAVPRTFHLSLRMYPTMIFLFKTLRYCKIRMKDFTS